MRAGGVKAVTSAEAMSRVPVWILFMMDFTDRSGSVRSSQGSRSAMHIATFSPEPLIMLMPDIVIVERTPGMAAIVPRISVMAASVRFCAAPGASSMLTITTPLSSCGRNDAGRSR